MFVYKKSKVKEKLPDNDQNCKGNENPLQFVTVIICPDLNKLKKDKKKEKVKNDCGKR